MDNTESEDGDELQGEEPEDDQPRVRIDDVVKALPLVNDDLYIGMQAMNLEIVDSMIESMEEDLLAEYIEKERTPIPSVMMVSALSQLWIFGVYELLRTWRQRVQSVLSFGDKASTMEPADRALACDAKEASFQRPEVDAAGVAPHVGAFRHAANSAEYREVLRTALYRSEIPFRRIESLRLHLAKHEVPKKHGLYGAGAGYSRINYDGSIQFHVPLGGNQMDLITRRQIADDVRKLSDDRPMFVLEPRLQAKLKGWQQSSYGVKHAMLILRDGTSHEGYVAWDRHIVFVRGYGLPPFGASEVVDLAEVPAGDEREDADERDRARD